MRFVLSFILTITLMLPVTGTFLAATATPAEAVGFSSSTSMMRTSTTSTMMRSTSMRSFSYRPSSTTFNTVRSYRPDAGGSNTMLYALAFMAIANSQANANDAPVRDATAASTYGVSNPTPPVDPTPFFVATGGIALALFMLMAAMHQRPRRHSDYY